jgi:hypothetical protein
LTYEDIDQMETKNDKPSNRQPDADTAKTKGNADYYMDKLNEIDKKVDDKIIRLGIKIDEVAGQMMSEFAEKMESLNGQMDELISSIYSNSVAPTHSVETCSYGTKHGGGIASFKSKLRPMLRKQFRKTLMRAPGDPRRDKVDVAEMLAMCEKALLETWDGSMAEHLNTQVGSRHSKKRARKENEASGSLDLA